MLLTRACRPQRRWLTAISAIAALWLSAGRPVAVRAQGPTGHAMRQSEADSLRTVLRTHPADTGAVRLYIKLSEALLMPDPVASGDAAAKGLALAKRLHDSRGEGLAEDMVGNALSVRGQFAESLKHFARARPLLPRSADRPALADVWNSTGIAHFQLGDYRAATDAYLHSLRVAEAVGDSIPIAKANVSLAIVASQLKRYPEAEMRYARALRMVRMAGPRGGILLNMAMIALDQNQVDSAAARAARGMATLRNLGSPRTLSVMTNLSGTIAQRQGDSTRAITLFREALAMAEPLEQPTTLVNPLLNLGEALVARNPRDPEAAPLLARALALTQELQMPDEERKAHGALAAAAEARGDYAIALRHRKQEIGIQDSIFTRDVAGKTAELKAEYELEKREQRARIQALELREKDLLLRRRTYGLLALGAALVAVLGIGAWLLTRTRLRSRLALAAERAAQQRARSGAVLEAEERERRRIGADLHDGVGQLLSAVKLNLSAFEHDLNATPAAPAQHEHLRIALDSLDEGLREMRSLSHQLVPNALLRHGLSGAVRELVGRVAAPAGLQIHLDMIGLERGLPPALESMLYRTIQEVIANVVKHARASEVTIQLLHHGAEVTVVIEDNGVGFDLTTIQARADGGIGLHNLAERVDYVGGRFTLDSRPGRGTMVSLEVPVGGG